MAKLVKVETISGGEADMYRMFFQSIGLEVMIVQESAGVTYGLTVGFMGEARIFCREEDVPKVEEALRKLDAGEYSLPDDYTAIDDMPVEEDEDSEESEE